MKATKLWAPLLLCLLLFWLAHRSYQAMEPTQSKSSTAQIENQTREGEFQNPASLAALLNSSSSKRQLHETDLEILKAALKERTERLRLLVQTDPEQALQASLSINEWHRLPEELRPLVEFPFNREAFVEVIPFCGQPGQAAVAPRKPDILVDGQVAVLAGSEIAFSSKSRLPVRGFELDGVSVIDSKLFQRLAPQDIAAASEVLPSSVRGITTDPVTGGPTSPELMVAIGGILHGFESEQTLLEITGALEDAASLPGPETLSEALDLLAGKSLVSAKKISKSAKSAASSWTETPKSVLFLRVNFVSASGTLLSPAFTQEELEEDLQFSSDRIEEMSYGKTHLEFSVTPDVLLIPEDSDHYIASYWDIYYDAIDAAIDAGYNTSAYDIVGVSVPRISTDWGGRGTISGGRQWLNGHVQTGTIIHEFGHNYGIHHAGYWSSDDGSAMGPGEHIEYGNTYDIMGWSPSNDDFNAYSKNVLNWVGNDWVKEATAPSSVYRLSRFDHPDAEDSEALLIKAQSPSSELFWINYRHLSDFRQGPVNGLHVLWDFDSGDRTRLLDMQPSPASTNHTDSRASELSIGQTFTDPTGTVRITPLAEGGTPPFEWIDVEVTIGSIGYTAWQETHFPSGGDAAATDADPDGDGLENLFEYAVGSDPLLSSGSGLSFPFFSQNQETFTFTKNPFATDVTFQVERSSNLKPDSWTSSGVVVINETGQELQARFLNPSSEREFFRLVVSLTGNPIDDAVQLTVQSAVASIEQDGNEALGAIDGDLSTRWSGEGVPETLTLDLGGTHLVQELRLAFFRGDERTADFSIEVSSDNSNFTEVLPRTSGSGNTLALQSFPLNQALNARWVRIVCYGNSTNEWNSINEAEVWGQP